ncbi:MAG: hypothetical protein BZY75_03900 [SAR202 cluster bacterium Io17-Chloro-G7]|nr:MAG: hypothetical protein BZY75_03900 [SAR202 cluster bacterium Io17-Chloro-G7]
MTSVQQWYLRGEYFENCNCEVLCPCLLPGTPQDPTEGHCDMAFAFHIEDGEHSGVGLDGLSFVVVMYVPGKMSDPNWTMAIYLDERAGLDQRAIMGSILSGDIGGPMERWMSLTSNYLGIKYVPITYKAEGIARSVSIPQIMGFNVEGIVRENQTEPMRLENWRPWAPSLVMARGTGNTYTDHGMSWDNNGKNGHYAKFQWP